MLYFIREICVIRVHNWSRRPWHPPSGQRRNDIFNDPRLEGQAVFSASAFFFLQELKSFSLQYLTSLMKYREILTLRNRLLWEEGMKNGGIFAFGREWIWIYWRFLL